MADTRKLVVGDMVKVKDEYLGRGGEWGEVIDVFSDGVALMFETPRGDDDCTEEWWALGELAL